MRFLFKGFYHKLLQTTFHPADRCPALTPGVPELPAPGTEVPRPRGCPGVSLPARLSLTLVS